MKVVCAAPNCKYSSDHEDSSHVIFVSFPNDDTATVWAHNCGRPDLIIKSNEELHLNYYICSDHIEDQYFLSKTNQIIITQGAIPTLFGVQMQSGRLDSLKPSYSSTDVMNPPELSDCQENYVGAASEYQNTIYNGNISSDNNGADEINGNEEVQNQEENNLNFENINVNMEQFEDMTMRFLNLCRICGKNASESINIFDGREDGVTLQQKIRLHLPIIMESGDGLPQKICGECCGKIESSHELVITSLLNDMRLRKFLNLPNKYNYEEKYRSLISKHELQSADDAFFDGITSGSCDLPKTPAEPSSPPSEKEKRLKFVLHSDLNNLILQPLHFQNDERAKTDLQRDAVVSATEVMIDQQSDELNCSDGHEGFQTECESTPVLTAEGNPQGEDAVLNNKDDGAVAPEQGSVRSSRRCGHCSQAFLNRKDMQMHLAEAHSGEGALFKCGMCDKSYEKWSSLDVHEATHRQDKPYLCDLCGKSFKHSNNLRGHKRVHLDAARKKRHVCETCGSAFRSRFHLREHMNQHDGNKPYVCEQCGKAFSKRIQLRQHRLSHGINKYACPICGMTFNRRGNMNTHFKRHSNSDGTYKCSVCDCKCKSMSDLKCHRKSHSLNDIIESIKQRSIDQTIWQCATCSRVFSKRTHLSNHERTHKVDQPKVECDKCGKKLASKSSLRYHVKSMHTCERTHLCQFCGNAFVSREARLIHERIHTGERPYSCKLCNMEYRCSSNLSQHMKAHAEVRPFVCQYCSKSFTRRSAMTVHERIHTGEKPFVCSVCNRGFSQKYDMVKHEKTHEPKTLNCEKCQETFSSKSEILKHLECSHKPERRATDAGGEYVEMENFDDYSLNVECPVGETDQMDEIQYS
ncbi:zinc finger protein 616 [Diachasma alloeum]|uniref:zinc finger protein 616 n=1 Tax=Diachasma alloeum TaxID=454923 RepID=UPI00073810A6|nr:zinc finger protein 616 [Diachasma alloeum]